MSYQQIASAPPGGAGGFYPPPTAVVVQQPQNSYGAVSGPPAAQVPYAALAGQQLATPVAYGAVSSQQPYTGPVVMVASNSATPFVGVDAPLPEHIRKDVECAKILAIIGILVPLANIICLLAYFTGAKTCPPLWRWVKMARTSLIIQVIIAIIVSATEG